MHDDRDVAGCAEEAPVELRPEQLHAIEQCDRVVRVACVVSCAERGGGPLYPAQTSNGTASVAIASISAAARSNSSSERTGVPSNGSWRCSSTHDVHPAYWSRPFTGAGGGLR